MSDQKKQKTTVLHMQRKFFPDESDGVIYREQRGLLTFEIGGEGIPFFQATNRTNLLRYAAAKILSAVGATPVDDVLRGTLDRGSNNLEYEGNTALLNWFSAIAAVHGPTSVPGIAAQFSSFYATIFARTVHALADANPEKPHDEVIKDAEAYMQRIDALCEAWHRMQMEVTGEHELAFAKVQHKAGALKGAKANQDKKEHRNAIVREQAALLPASDKPRGPSEIARRIRVQTLAAFKAAGLDHDYSDATFDKIVRRALN